MPAFDLIAAIESHPGLMTVSDVARLLRKSPTRIYALIRNGAIPVIELGFDSTIMVEPRAWVDKLRALNPNMRNRGRN